jgi:hypothetical protein
MNLFYRSQEKSGPVICTAIFVSVFFILSSAYSMAQVPDEASVPVVGCTDVTATNFDELATVLDNELCIYSEVIDDPACPDNLCTYNDVIDETTCPDTTATNYGEVGDCVYVETTPAPVGECEIEGHKYDIAGNPLADWTIGLMKVVTYPERSDIYDLVSDTTNADGYYCLEWDGYTNTPTNLTEPHSFLYQVYETLKTGWTNVKIEKGADVDALAVVPAVDIHTEGAHVSTQIGEENGYIYADVAYHVDFYNQETPDDTPATYLVAGYVWHDKNANDSWERDLPATETFEETEPELGGWVVKITDGETTRATTTDATGRYYFYVPVGTWTITEEVQSEWDQTFPNSGTHTVVVTGIIETALNSDDNFFAAVIDWLAPRAIAAEQTLPTYGLYDFGNVFVGCTSNCDNNNDNNNGGGRGGTRLKSTPVGEILGATTTSLPPGVVLGEATSTMPVGAPNTGGGGTAPVATALPTLIAILATRSRVPRTVRI